MSISILRSCLLINSKTSSIYLILTYECKDFSNQKREKQKTPLLRGSCLNPLGGGYLQSLSVTFRSALNLLTVEKNPAEKYN